MEEAVEQIDLSCFSGNLRHDDDENSRDCWRISDGNNFSVRSKNFCKDKSKVSRLLTYLIYVCLCSLCTVHFGLIILVFVSFL